MPGAVRNLKLQPVYLQTQVSIQAESLPTYEGNQQRDTTGDQENLP